MKVTHVMMSTVSAIALLCSAQAMAADGKMTGDTARPAVSAGAKTDGSAMQRSATGSVQRATDIEADKLLGESVKNLADETVGDVESVIIGQNGKVQAIVVGVGGFLGLGERLVAIDWNDVQIRDNGDDVRVPWTKDQLKALPEYKYRDTAWRGTSYRDDTYARTTAERRADMRADRRDRPLKEAASADSLMDARGNLKASELIGMEVVNAKQDVIGEIEEIVFTKDGQVSAVLGTGGFLGMGEKRTLVAWNKLEMHRKGDQVQIRTAMTADDLRKMPYDESR